MGPIVLPEALKSIPHLSVSHCEKKRRRHRGKRPIDFTGLAFMIHATEEEKEGKGRESGREEGDTAGAADIKTLENGGDLWVIALLSTTHSRPIYSWRAQGD